MDADVNGNAEVAAGPANARPPADGIGLLVPPSVVYGPTVVALIAASVIGRGVASAAASLGVGIVAWTLGEYLVHRFVEHGTIVDARYVANHLRHHEEPWPAEHFVYSLRQTLPILPLVLAEGWLLNWEIYRALGTTAGIVGCYLVNEWVHFLAHRPALTRGRPLFAWLARNHLRHHHEDARRHFGFFTTAWDRVFGSH